MEEGADQEHCGVLFYGGSYNSTIMRCSGREGKIDSQDQGTHRWWKQGVILAYRPSRAKEWWEGHVVGAVAREGPASLGLQRRTF